MKKLRNILALLSLAALLGLAAEDAVRAAPTRPSKSLKVLAYHKLPGKVLAYAKSKLTQQVGDGQCWALVNEALKSAGAHQPGTDGYATYVFGTVIPLASIAPGDVIQFENVVFGSQNFPHHTSIVTSVTTKSTRTTEVWNGKGPRPSPVKRRLVVGLIHQNINNVKTVQLGTIDFADLKPGGTMTAYRPAPR